MCETTVSYFTWFIPFIWQNILLRVLSLLEHGKQVENVVKTKGEYVVKAKTALEKMTPARTRRASKAALESTLSNLNSEVKRIKEETEQRLYKISFTLLKRLKSLQ